MSGKQDDLIFGLIMMLIIAPVAAIGLILFGTYALQGEYDEPIGNKTELGGIWWINQLGNDVNIVEAVVIARM